MESYLSFAPYDLVSPDGRIAKITPLSPTTSRITLKITDISPAFKGFHIDASFLHFNLKSTLAQLGLNSKEAEISLNSHTHSGEASLILEATPTPLSQMMLSLLTPGASIGKLFAADPERRVCSPSYLTRMFGRSDHEGRPLLLLGKAQDDDLFLEEVEGRVVAYLAIKLGHVTYEPEALGLLPTLARALHRDDFKVRQFLQLTQTWVAGEAPRVKRGEMLLAKTLPLHVRTVFAKVVNELLPRGVNHTSAFLLQPDTKASGDIYEFYGESSEPLTRVPLEFYTLEPHREHLFFADRDQLQETLEKPQELFKAFESAPAPSHLHASVFIVKGSQLIHLKPSDWIAKEPHMVDFPGLAKTCNQAELVSKYLKDQSAYPFLKAIETGLITSEGVLFTRYFPTPLMKRMLLGDQVHKLLKGIYFNYPSLSYGDYFSHEDRSLLLDLAKFGIPTYWVDEESRKILQYTPKPGKDSGMFVPLDQTETFLQATLFGVYGSHLVTPVGEGHLKELMEGVLELKQKMDHPLLNPVTPIAMVTGGGPGSMSLGNRIAKELGILSCANIMDFRGKKDSVIHEQETNPYIDAKMTYRLDKLVERQSEFNLDFPIFLMGGIGTDFEFALEEVRRKVGSTAQNPVLLLGSPGYWREKITARFRCNLSSGTLAGSEWVSNCFYCVQNAEEGLRVYREFFRGTLPIGKLGPVYEEGFCASVPCPQA